MKNSNLRQFKSVTEYEFKNIVRNKIFIIFTVLFSVIIIAGAFLPPLISGFKDDDKSRPGDMKKEMVIVNDKHDLISDKDLFKQMFVGYEIRFSADNYNDSIAEKIRADEYIGAVEVLSEKYNVYSRNSMVSSFQYEITEILKVYEQYASLSQVGLEPTEVTQIMTPPVVEAIDVAGKDAESTYALTYALIIVLYMSIMLYGQMVAGSVVTEKSSRAMELLITSAKPNNLMFGKILGVGTAGLFQFSLWIIIGVLSLGVNSGYWNEMPFIAGMMSATPSLFALMFLFYILGYFMYAALFAALGSVVSRVEELNSVVTPVVLINVIGFMIAIFGMMNPDTLLLKVCSFIPFFAPMCMFVRISMSTVPIWQIAASIVLTSATAVFFGWLSAKIYRVGVLMYGKAPSFKELAKVLKSTKNY